MGSEVRHYIYIFKPVARLLNENSWTEKDRAVFNSHIKYTERLLRDERLLFAGRTADLNERSFGAVVFEAKNEEEAYTVMKEDPAVSEGILEAEIYPYKVALMAGTGGLEL